MRLRLKDGVLLLSLIAIFVVAQTVRADEAAPTPAGAETEKRLIQTSPTDRQWMTETELNEFIRGLRMKGTLGGYMDVTDLPDKVTAPLLANPVIDDRQPRHGPLVESLGKELSSQYLQETVTKLSSFRTRYCRSESGLSAATWIRDQFATLGRNRTDTSVSFFQHKIKQPSVVARIEGYGPKASELIVLGAHADSIAASFGIPLPNLPAPGADDNASGVATIIEVFRVLTRADFRPQRTIEFIAYAGEEVGLIGSQAIAQAYRAQGKNVVAVLQLDMTMFPGPVPEIALISDHVYAPLTQFLGMLLDRYVRIPWKMTECGYACSDHASWTEAGFSAAYPFEALGDRYNPNIHTENDTTEFLDPSFGMHFARLALAFAVELSAD